MTTKQAHQVTKYERECFRLQEQLSAAHAEIELYKIAEKAREVTIHTVFSQALQLAERDLQIKELREALHKLACLGNGDSFGNSIGNAIAQQALSKPYDESVLKQLIGKRIKEWCGDYEAECYLESLEV